jgi:hypothetical protein
LLDARYTHLLLPGFRQPLLNRFELPNPFTQHDPENFAAQLRGELPSALGSTPLWHQSGHSLAGKIRRVSLQRGDVPSKSGRQILLLSQPALGQLNHRQAKASFISRGPAHIQLPFDQNPSRPAGFHDLDEFGRLPSRKVQLIHVPGPFSTASRRWERTVKKPSRNYLKIPLLQSVVITKLAKLLILGWLFAKTSEPIPKIWAAR